MKSQEPKDNQKILSIEEYKKKQATAKTTATGDIPQTPQRETDKTASILTFTPLRQKEETGQKAPLASSKEQKGNVIYMKGYLKSADSFKQPVSPDGPAPLSENEISPVQTSASGNIVMMNEYLKRKTLDVRVERDWEKDLQSPPFSGSQKWRASAVAAVVLAMMAFPLFNNSGNEDMTAEIGKGGDKNLNGAAPPVRRGLANKIKETSAKDTEIFQPAGNGTAERSPQSLSPVEGGLFLSAGRKPAGTTIKSGRKPTLKEQQNGY